MTRLIAERAEDVIRIEIETHPEPMLVTHLNDENAERLRDELTEVLE